MHAVLRKYWPISIVICLIATISSITLFPYHGNITALFHMDRQLANQYIMPHNFVVLSVPSYDGAQYYQIARNIPLIINPAKWRNLRLFSPGAYAYQRILLPLTAWLLAFGQDALLPPVFLLINIISALGICFLMLSKNKPPIYALALSLCPATMIGLHFSLAEPLTLLILTAFLLRYSETEKITNLDIGMLSLLVLAREVNIVFIALLICYSLIRKKLKQILGLCIPIVIFTSWHFLLYKIFHQTPFLWSAEKNDVPFVTMMRLIFGYYGYNRLTLTSIPLAVLVIVAIVWIIKNLIQKRDAHFVSLASLAFLILMTLMPDHIWGSITSIGRVITPIYPLLLIYASKERSFMAYSLAVSILIIGIGAGFSLAIVQHPFTLTL